MTTPTGIGLTAIAMAQERLVESRRADRLFDDPLAETFITAVARAGCVEMSGLVDGVTLGDLVPEFRGFVALRTRCFDDRLQTAAARGFRQFVILAAGLDTRAYRLPLQGCTVYELDAADVTLFKEAAVKRGGPARASRIPLTADLREDFADTLESAGFDREAPTVWLLEGLLMYLHPEAVDQLVCRVAKLSAGNSMLLVDQFSSHVWTLAERRSEQVGALDRVGASWLSTIDAPLDWLAGHGWDAELVDLNRLAAELERDTPAVADGDGGTPAVWLATAVRR